jgi:multiple sugar transport system substrate-binding protein
MSERSALRGMAWDHPRARGPLEAISAEWSRECGFSIVWDARPLKDFEDQALDELAMVYDLVLIDHPFVGFAATSKLLLPVDDWVDRAYLADQAAHSVGPSYPSYTWSGNQWALAIDAACQVSASRSDLCSAASVGPLPETWADVSRLAQHLRSAISKVAIPLNPNHAYCTFLAIGASIVGEGFWPTESHINRAAALESLEFLRHLAVAVHPVSRHADPILISDHMTYTNEISYVPLMFGYSNYARPGFRPLVLHFSDAPRGESGKHGSVLGGVGLAVSARSSRAAEAADLARKIAGPDAQCGLYARSGGQPGHAAAWDSPDINQQTAGFFTATRSTIDQAFMRPRVAGHRRFQQLAGEVIHRFIWVGDTSAEACLSEFEGLVDSLLWRTSRRAVE